MQARFLVEHPDKVEVTLKMTMPISDWEKLRDQLERSTLSTSYPTWTFVRHIADLIAQARKVLVSRVPDDGAT